MQRETFWLSALPQFPPTGAIPRIVHQTFGTANLPPPLADNVARLKAMNRGWEHRLYDDRACERLISDHYGAQVLALYRRINPDYGAARADLFRYLAIYAVGGVYLDIKSYFDRPIDAALGPDDSFIVAYWDNAADGAHPKFGRHAELADHPRGEIQQWHVIADRGHPFLRAVIARVLANIERYLPWRMGVGRIGVLRTTGPIAYTRAIAPILDRHPHRAIADPGLIGLHYSIADDYRHEAVFTRHYSLHTTPVVAVPGWAKPAARLYGYLKERQQRAAARRAAAGD